MPENDADGDNQRRRRVGPLLRTPLEVAITVLVFAGVSATFIYLRSMHENAF